MPYLLAARWLAVDARCLFTCLAVSIFCSCQDQPAGKERPGPQAIAPGVQPMPQPAALPANTLAVIYLSFDDGPVPGSAVVNRLSLQDSLPADVFLIGKKAMR